MQREKGIYGRDFMVLTCHGFGHEIRIQRLGAMAGVAIPPGRGDVQCDAEDPCRVSGTAFEFANTQDDSSEGFRYEILGQSAGRSEIPGAQPKNHGPDMGVELAHQRRGQPACARSQCGVSRGMVSKSRWPFRVGTRTSEHLTSHGFHCKEVRLGEQLIGPGTDRRRSHSRSVDVGLGLHAPVHNRAIDG